MGAKHECRVLAASEHLHHHLGTEKSECFYFEQLPLRDLVRICRGNLVARAARIEVSDTEDLLHQHAGATIVFIAAGEGIFKMEAGSKAVHMGDIIYVPPMTPHLSIAESGTVMTELVVYIGDYDDLQKSLPVESDGITNQLHILVRRKGFTRDTFIETLRRQDKRIKRRWALRWFDENRPLQPTAGFQYTIAQVLDISVSELEKLTRH